MRSSPSADDLIPAAKKWIAENPEAQQPWDADKKYKIPGGTPSTPSFAANLPAFPANLRKQIKGANMPAPLNIMAAAVEGAQVDFDNALEIEGRYFVDLATGQVAKNMIQAFFFDLNRVNGDRGRAGRRRALQGQEGRRARRRHDGRRDRLRLRQGRDRGRAQGRLAGGGRARQAVLGEPGQARRSSAAARARRRAMRCWRGSTRPPTRPTPTAPTS